MMLSMIDRDFSAINRPAYRRYGKRLFSAFLLTAVLGLTLCVMVACAAAARTASPRPPAGTTPHWSYEGDTGPEYWYALDSAYATARDGKAQSPIDILTAELIPDGDLVKPLIAYRKTPFKMENNGHTIELLPAAAGNTIVLDGESYELQQFHFHAPSEHLFDGVSFAMELHLVHKDARGNLAVIGMMITEGARNETLGEIFENLPGEIGGEGSLEPKIDLAELFTGSREMCRYDGSLTTPPCTEGVKWSISLEPVEMSPHQIEAFRALYRGNKRPVQNRYGRPVYLAKNEE
jgi:carbonic anhydrase